MRGAVVFEAIVRVLEACIPNMLSENIEVLCEEFLIDFFSNYCFDFWLFLIVNNLQRVTIIVLKSVVLVWGSASLFRMHDVWLILVSNILIVALSAYFGRQILVLGHYKSLYNHHFRFANNMKDGIITVDDSTREVSFLNKSALSWLTTASDQKNVVYREVFDPQKPMFRRTLESFDSTHDVSAKDESAVSSSKRGKICLDVSQKLYSLEEIDKYQRTD